MEQAIEKTIARSLKAATPQEALHELIASAVENRTLICKLLDSQKWAPDGNAVCKRDADLSAGDVPRQAPRPSL